MTEDRETGNTFVDPARVVKRQQHPVSGMNLLMERFDAMVTGTALVERTVSNYLSVHPHIALDANHELTQFHAMLQEDLSKLIQLAALVAPIRKGNSMDAFEAKSYVNYDEHRADARAEILKKRKHIKPEDLRDELAQITAQSLVPETVTQTMSDIAQRMYEWGMYRDQYQIGGLYAGDLNIEPPALDEGMQLIQNHIAFLKGEMGGIDLIPEQILGAVDTLAERPISATLQATAKKAQTDINIGQIAGSQLLGICYADAERTTATHALGAAIKDFSHDIDAINSALLPQLKRLMDPNEAQYQDMDPVFRAQNIADTRSKINEAVGRLAEFPDRYVGDHEGRLAEERKLEPNDRYHDEMPGKRTKGPARDVNQYGTSRGKPHGETQGSTKPSRFTRGTGPHRGHTPTF